MIKLQQLMKFKQMKNFLITFLIILSIILTFCGNPDKSDILPEYGSGVFILNEGGYMHGNSTLSYYDPINKTIKNDIFTKKNDFPLGDQAQSLYIYENLVYITVCNDGKLYSLDKNTFEFHNKITNLISPRYIIFLNANKAYISDMWGKCIYVVNPQTYTLLKTINLDAHNSKNPYQHSSEEMVIIDNLLFTNSWNYDNKILVIDTNTDDLTDSIEVLVQPKKMVLDKNNKLWVLCDGSYSGSILSGEKGIVKINTQTRKVEQTFLFNNQTSNNEYIVNDMKINASKDTIYYIYKDVYQLSIYSTELSTIPYIKSENNNFYALGIDPSNSDLYISDVVDYMQNGVIYRYNSNKELIDNFGCGIIPSCFGFK